MITKSYSNNKYMYQIATLTTSTGGVHKASAQRPLLAADVGVHSQTQKELIKLRIFSIEI